jgi:hypothetical protein
MAGKQQTRKMKTAHTPGPWVYGYGQTKETGEVLGVGIETEPDWQPICVVSQVENVTKEDISNARLIAAAPDLLDDVLLLLERCDESDGAQYGTISTKYIRLLFKNSIAKATGGEA